MNEQAVIDILFAAFTTALRLASPLLLTSLGIGLFVSIFQAATQINEQTLTFVPKLVGIGILLVLLSPWMLTVLRDFVTRHFERLLTFM